VPITEMVNFGKDKEFICEVVKQQGNGGANLKSASLRIG
jgi:hypothetical protein